MSDIVLKVILQSKTSLKALDDFCSQKGKLFCTQNKETVCRRALKISDYKPHPKISSCEIYAELSKLVKKIPEGTIRPGTQKSVIKMDKVLLDLAKDKASNDLRAFLVFNGVQIPLEAQSKLIKARNVALRLAGNPLVRKQVKSLFGL